MRNHNILISSIAPTIAGAITLLADMGQRSLLVGAWVARMTKRRMVALAD